MTGGGAPGAPGILHCLQQDSSLRITLADANPNAVGRHLHNSFLTIPFASDPSFIDAVLSLCRKENIRAIIPLVTKELIPFSQRKSDFEEAGINVLVSPAPSLEIANNKSRLYEFLQWRGMSVPNFRIVETVEQFIQAVEELGYPGQPICFKPSVSNGSRGFRIISDEVNQLDLLFNHKPSSVFISLADAKKILSTGKFPELLVSEWLPGDEYSVDCLGNHGEQILAIPRLRKRMINGISVEGEIVKNDEIINYCAQIVKELQLHGNIGIQVKCSSIGKYLILEINPRVQGTIVAALGAGVNLPLLAIRQELGLPVTPGDLQVKWGTKFVRYWKELFY